MPKYLLALCVAAFAVQGICFGEADEGSAAIPESVAEREAAIRDAASRIARALASPAAIDARGITSWGDLAEAIARTHKINVDLQDSSFDNAGALTCDAAHIERGDMTLRQWVTRVLSDSVTSPSWEPECREWGGVLLLGFLRRGGEARPESARFVGGTRFEGTVRTGAGKPAPNAVVEFRGGFGNRVFTATDAHGRFELPRPNASPKTCEVVARDASKTGMTYFRFPKSEDPRPTALSDPHEPKRLAIELKLEPPRRIKVEVVDRDGMPVAGARVGWRSSTLGQNMATQEAATDEKGLAHFALPVAQPIAFFIAIARGHGADCVRFPSNAKNFSDTVTAAEVPDFVRLQVTGATTVTLQVCDERGAPWPGLPVHLLDLRKPIEKRGTFGESLSFVSSWGFVARVTDEQGMVTFDWIPDWHTSVWKFDVPYSQEFVGGASRMVMRAEAAKGPVVMTLPRRVAITGRVVDTCGTPAAGAVVTAVNASHEPSHYRSDYDSAETDDSGRYHMNVPPNRLYLLRARHNDRQLAGMKDGIVVESGKPLADLDISIHPMARVFGRVTFAPDGKPAAKMSLTGALVGRELSAIEGAVLPNPKNNQKPVQPEYAFRAETDAEGRFEFPACPGTYTLRPYGKSPQPKEVTFTVTDTPPREFNFQIEPPDDPKSRHFVGKVVNGDPLKPVEEAEVQVVSRPAQGIGLSWGSVTTRADGRFSVTRPKDTTWIFARSKDGKHAGTADIESGQAEVTLALVPTATMKVRLVDAAGEPLPAGVKFEWGIRIDMGELAKGVPMSKLLSTQKVETDEEGQLILKDMTVGVPHDVNQAQGEERWRRSFQVTAASGGDQIWPKAIVVKIDE